MEQNNLYTSCIKINGVPILPPLMTEDIREEVNYYKQLAVAVEERLKYLRLCDNKKRKSEEVLQVEAEKSCSSKKDEDSNINDSSDTVTTSSDLNHSLNDSSSKSNTVETTPEPTSKPQVPKTLDIMPISLNDSVEPNEPRKMVRQGSYVLDTPSPILLAHMNSSGPYIPSGSQATAKRREWNLSQTKSKWVGSTIEAKIRPRRNSASNVHTRINKLSTPKGKACLSCRSAKSVDSIHTILNQDGSSVISSDVDSSRSATPVNGEKVSILALADQVGQTFTTQNRQVSPERVMGFFQEIQEMQKKQMIELLEKQQKEQLMMQQQFKKQQSALVSQIKKAFPGVVLTVAEAQCDSDNNQRCPDYVYPDRDLGRDSNDNFTCRMTRSLDNEAMFQRDASFCPETMSCDNDCHDDTFSRRRSSVSRRLFNQTKQFKSYSCEHHRAATVINAHVRGYLVRRLMNTEQVIALKNTYKEALHCLLKLYVDAPLSLSELNFHRRLQLQLDAASSSIVDLFAQEPVRKMKIIAHDREVKKFRTEKPTSARSYMSFATQRTLARKKMRKMGEYTPISRSKSTSTIRARCQTWTSDPKDKPSVNINNDGIKRSTSAGAVRKPWR